ncbi:MAG: hypothetical protein RIK87_24920 [Fuerstiella sp.]
MTVDEVNQLVEEIQQVLAFATDPTEEELIDLAARHDDFVQQVAARLKAVEKLLNKGLRAEAIALAEQVPNLNDLVTALDFPELEVWNDCLVQFAIQPVRELDVDVAAELNDAYTVAAPVERLLNHYRTQSLARAPVAERIDTLRQLAVTDTANSQWKTDLRKFETHRLTLLKKELQASVKQQDLDLVAALDQELSDAKWSVSVPAALKKTAHEAHIQLRRRSARAELQPLCHQLSDAYAAFDQPTATRLQKRFFALSEILDLDETDPLYDIAGPALDWLNEEEAKATAEADFQNGKSQLESALERHTTIDELERLYHQTVRHGHALPEVLEHRLADRIDTLKSAEARKRTTLLTSIVAGCLVGIVAVVMVVRYVAFQNAVAGHVLQASKLLQEVASSGDLQPVDDYFASMETEDVRYLDQPEILGLKEQLESVRRQELGRQQQLEQLISDALNHGTENPRWENFPLAEDALQKAETVALNESEKARILNVRSQIQAVQAEMQRTVDDAFEKDQQEVVELVAKLPTKSLTGYSSVKTRLSELEQRDHVSSELKSALSALKAKVSQQQAMVQAELDMQRSLQKVTAAVGQPAAYRQALIDYTREHPGTERAEDFLQVIKSDLPLWESVDQWNRIRRRLQNLSFKSVSPAEAKSVVTEIDALQAFPGTTNVTERLDALKAVAAREGSSYGSSREQIERMFAPRTISQAWLVQTIDGKKYLTERPPRVEGSKISFDYFTTTTGTQTEQEQLGMSKLPGADNKTDDYWLAPQTLMSRKLQPQLKVQLEADFEAAIAFGVEALLKEDEVDSILRFLLIEKLLRTGAEGSVFIQHRTNGHLENIAGAGVSRLTNWAAPRDRRADDERRMADEFLSAHGTKIVEDLKTAHQDVQAIRDIALGPAMQCVGWLHRDTESQWVISLRDELQVPEPTQLQSLGHVDGAPKFQVVAAVSGSAIGTVPASFAANGIEGQPVYRESTSTIPLARR